MDDEVRKALRAVQLADQEIELFFALFWRVKDKILDMEMHRDAALQQLITSAIESFVPQYTNDGIDHIHSVERRLSWMVKLARDQYWRKYQHLYPSKSYEEIWGYSDGRSQ